MTAGARTLVRSRTLLLALAAGLALTGPPAVESSAGDDSLRPRTDTTIKDWYQRRGNAARTGISTFEPVRTQPALAWKVELGGELASNLVTWDGVVYLAVTTRKGCELRAYDVTDGSARGKRGYDSDWLELAVWNGTVIVRHKAGIAFHAHKNGAFRLPAKWDGSFSGPPLVHDGKCYAVEGAGLVSRKVGSRKDAEHEGLCRGSPSVQLVRGREELVRAWIEYSDDYRNEYLAVSGFGRLGLVETSGVSTGGPPLTVHRIEEGRKGGWIVVGDVAVLSTKGQTFGVLFPDGEDGFFAYDIVSETIVRRGHVIGWTREKTLIEVGLDGTRPLMSPDNAPQGFHGRGLAGAQDVLYVGNTAVDMDSGRVLWTVDALKPATPLIPAGDARIVVVSTEDVLMGLAAEAPRAEPDAKVSASADAERSPAPPDADGVLLRDGTFVTGVVEAHEDGGVRVTVKGSKPREIHASDIAVATRGGAAVGAHDEFLAYRAWRDALHGEISAALEEFVLRCIRERFLEAGREVLERARGFGLSEQRISELGSRMTGLTENANTEIKLPRLREEERELEAKLSRRVLAGSEWLQARGLDVAAAALLNEAADLPGTDYDWSARAALLAPTAFPFSAGANGGHMWARWARALLPSGGRFLARSDPALARHTRAPWNNECIGLATRNVVLLSRSSDPDVVGGCLQRGETAIRALETMLCDVPPERPGPPLVVLLHRNRKEYLAERTPGGSAPKWSAGYYSPGERVSRFFVPSAEQSGDPLGRGLYSTLAHELTHHWVDTRWAGSRTSTPVTNGYWVVEGIAQFVGDQAADSDPYTVRLDDIGIPSLDAMAQAAAAGKAMPLSDFIDLTQIGFAALSDEEVAIVQLRNTLERRVLSRRSLFYEQSAALTWFLMNRRGDDGREHLRRYLWAYYSGTTPKGGWKSLGFASRQELADAFAAFLAEVSGKPVTLPPGSNIAGGPDLPAAQPKGHRTAGVAAPGVAKAGTFEVGDSVWVRHGDELVSGNITGERDGRFWISYFVGNQILKVLVPPSELKHRAR